MDDFTFYLKFTKPIIFDLPNLKDRVMASLWLNKLTEINKTVPMDNLHVEYLKLLLFALQKNHLTGIFTEHPPEGSLPQYPEMNTAMDMVKLLIPKKKCSSYPSIYTTIGSGMSEFAAIQEIPNFGLHGYYAISDEPLPLWMQNKTRLLKKNGNKKQIHRHKDSLEYKMLKEINSKKTEPQKIKLKGKLMNDIQDNSIANDMDLEEENERREISRNEIRPCWGTNRYFEKLLDQSPHITTDLEMITTDTLLHVLKNKKLDRKGIKDDSCVSSVKEKSFKKTFDITPHVYESELKGTQYQSNSEEQLENFEQNVGIDDTRCYINDIPRKSCFLNPDYYSRL